ncbi:MAG TPA: hypothetical protein VG269_02065 [Tepidisphaeraceae bacterium]|jgi:hypothetical protein|nr:hypothetical protein [Tepidisphaeraceae bacterium]
MHLLADDMSKFFLIVIFAILWGVGAIASAVKKANEEATRKRARQPMVPRPAPPARQIANTFDRFVGNAPVGGRRPIATPPAVARQAQALAQMTNRIRPPVRQAATRPTPPTLSQRRIIPAPPPLRPPAQPALRAPAQPALRAPAPAPARPALTTEQAPRAHRTAPSTSVAAPAIRRWLRPGVLRRQFILTELLQPPLALREERE